MIYRKIRLFFLGLLLICTAYLGSVFAQSGSSGVPAAWQTTTEASNYAKTPRYEETVTFAKKLDAASNLITYQSFGKSGEGRDIPLLIAAKGGTFTPDAVRKAGKAVILIQACIHAGESDGKDAGLALLRDIAITKTRADLLDNTVVVFIPIYNVDGHEIFGPYNRMNQNGPDEMGWRATSAGLNLNRDYMKADAPETRAWLSLWNKWKPDFFIDCHVTDGADFRYNVTYEYAHFQEVSSHIKDWMGQYFEKNVVPKTESEGNLLSHYLEFNGREVTSGVSTFIATPRYATGYTALRNRAGLLIETHMLKNYRSRVRGTYDLLRYTIEEIGKNKASLFEANKKGDAETVERGLRFEETRQFPLRLGVSDKSEPFALKGVEYKVEDSNISGAKRIVYGTKPIDITIQKFDEGKVTVGIAPPVTYIIPPQWRNVIDVLKAHGVSLGVTPNSVKVEVQSYRLTEPRWAATPFEGRNAVNYKTTPITETRTYPAGSVIVWLSQETANVAIHLLEPQSPDSFVAWGFFNPIFEQKEYGEGYVIEKLAREMLEKDPQLKREFEERLKDPKFAASASERLRFFYDRSPYLDKRIGVYPVGRITDLKDMNLFK